MAWTPTGTQLGACLVSSGTLDGSDDAFTFNARTIRFHLSTPAASVTMYPAAASSGNNGLVFPAATLHRNIPIAGLAGKAVTFVGTSTQVLSIWEELSVEK